ncbi:alpha/beta hydrolase [Lentzea sp. NPDC005914]|uniref:alpha/beta hydrolase n=1 Tax=Lentzea sp. NPDC005914 TaxID=3154572 RepID=UPI0033F4F206
MDFVMLHGTTQTPACWRPLRSILEQQGHRTFAADLTDQPGWQAEDYAEEVHRQFPETDSPTVIAHSGGGLLAPATAKRLDAGHIVWIGALIPDLTGTMSMMEELEDHGEEMFPPEWFQWSGADLLTDQAVSAYFLFHDCDLEQLKFALGTLRLFQPQGAFTQRHHHDDLPKHTVIVPRQDRVIRPEWMCRAAQERLGTSAIEIDGDHCPHIPRAQEIAEIILRRV